MLVGREVKSFVLYICYQAEVKSFVIYVYYPAEEKSIVLYVSYPAERQTHLSFPYVIRQGGKIIFPIRILSGREVISFVQYICYSAER